MSYNNVSQEYDHDIRFKLYVTTYCINESESRWSVEFNIKWQINNSF